MPHVLTREETDGLFRAMRAAPDPRSHPARERLILDNLGVALYAAERFLARRVRPGGRRRYDDLFGWARLTLCKAVDRFDPDRGYAFASYLYDAVSKDLLVEFDRLRSARYLPKHAVVKMANHRKAGGDRGTAGGGLLGAAFDAVKAAAAVTPDLPLPYAEPSFDAVDDRDEVEHALSRLDDAEREVVRRMFGLDGRRESSLRDAAMALGMGRGRADHIKAVAFRKMKAMRAAG